MFIVIHQYSYPAGLCGADGFYYNDQGSFVMCSNGNSYVQPCAPGSRNSDQSAYSSGNTYTYRDFCDVNLVDYGYNLAHGNRGYSNDGYGSNDVGYKYQDSGYGKGSSGGYGSNSGYGNTNAGYGNDGYGNTHQSGYGSTQQSGYGNPHSGYGQSNSGYGQPPAPQKGYGYYRVEYYKKPSSNKH